MNSTKGRFEGENNKGGRAFINPRWGLFLQTPVGTTFWCGMSNHQAATAQMGT